jgi:D-alanine-D-alanine ligase
MRKLRVLVLVHEDHVPPESLDGYTEKEILEWKTEYDVVTTLREMGHEAEPLGVRSDLGVIREKIVEWKPHIAFNLLEEFHGVAVYDQHVISYLELMRQHYTGCNPRGLMLAHDKALSKKILSYHRIRVPRFSVFPMGKAFKPPKSSRFPLFVKSVVEEGSYGISQASIVHNEQKLQERVEYLQQQLATNAIAEEYIEGRELYVAILGNRRLRTFPILELVFEKMPEGAPRIATSKVKWDWAYQKKRGIKLVVVKDLGPEMERKIFRLCKRIYRTLSLSGYARIDLRLTESGDLYVLEANPNADVGYGEEMSEATEAVGWGYADLLQRILNLGLRYQAEWRLA